MNMHEHIRDSATMQDLYSEWETDRHVTHEADHVCPHCFSYIYDDQGAVVMTIDNDPLNNGYVVFCTESCMEHAHHGNLYTWLTLVSARSRYKVLPNFYRLARAIASEQWSAVQDLILDISIDVGMSFNRDMLLNALRSEDYICDRELEVYELWLDEQPEELIPF